MRVAAFRVSRHGRGLVWLRTRTCVGVLAVSCRLHVEKILVSRIVLVSVFWISNVMKLEL